MSINLTRGGFYHSSHDRIGPYILQRHLGCGSNAAVYRAEGPMESGRAVVALKIETRAWRHPGDRERELAIWQESCASGHPNILRLHRTIDHDGRGVVVCEYAPDGSLHQWVADHGDLAPPAERVVSFIAGVLAGLSHLHELEIVHRDIKPKNVLISAGCPKLADFGTARRLDPDGRYHGPVMGSLPYMAPECWSGEWSPRSDVWAVGITLYQALTGRFPFPRRGADEMMRAGGGDALDPDLNGIATAARDIIARAIERNPARRFQTAGEMFSALLG